MTKRVNAREREATWREGTRVRNLSFSSEQMGTRQTKQRWRRTGRAHTVDLLVRQVVEATFSIQFIDGAHGHNGLPRLILRRPHRPRHKMGARRLSLSPPSAPAPSTTITTPPRRRGATPRRPTARPIACTTTTTTAASACTIAVALRSYRVRHRFHAEKVQLVHRQAAETRRRRRGRAGSPLLPRRPQ